MEQENSSVQADLTDHVGFIGLGEMGGNMARNLLAAGVRLTVFDERRELAETYTDLGASFATSPGAVARAVDQLFLCLPFTPHVEVALFAEDGVCPAAANKGLSVIDTSTIHVEDARDFQSRLASFGIAYSDCPISGLPFRAENATLTMMYGGARADYEAALPYLQLMGNSILYCGDCGLGQMMKAFNNVIYDINIAAISEMMPLAVKSGLNPAVLETVFTEGSSRSFASEHFVPKMMKRQFDGDYTMDGAIKDIVNVEQMIADFGHETPVFDAMTKAYREAIGRGFGHESKSAMLKVYEEAFGVKVEKPAAEDE